MINKKTQVQSLLEAKEEQLGKLMQAILFDNSIFDNLKQNGPQAMTDGFNGESFDINGIDLTSEDGIILQKLANESTNFRELAGKLIPN